MSGKLPVIAVLGLGEAGTEFARDLRAAGAVVRGYDPVVDSEFASEAEAAAGADLVLSVNSSAAAVGALRAGLPAVSGIWADLNTASPGKKRELAAIAAEAAVDFADVAIMAPVPGKGLRVPLLASGPAADGVARILGGLGASVEALPGEAGLAAERKLLRSVFFKGMSAAVVEALEAARAAGVEDWLREVIVAELTGANESTVERLVTGSHKHARRRTAEMAAAAEMLGELGVAADVAAASRDQLARLSSGSSNATSVPRLGEELR